VQKNARPAKHDVAMEVNPLASGRDIRRPMVVEQSEADFRLITIQVHFRKGSSHVTLHNLSYINTTEFHIKQQRSLEVCSRAAREGEKKKNNHNS
jgi:hypothetical protein